ncbi:hypothetical protein ACHAXR_006122 [Thalassiosira sp. AJA248-18]
MTHDDLNEDDDFFSDNHDEQVVPSSTGNSWQQQQQQRREEEDAFAASAPVATKLDVTADEGDDFFGDEDPSPVVEEQFVDDQKISENGNDEEVDFGADGGDGWDDGDDIPFDDVDVDDSSPVQHQEQVEEDVLQEAESNAVQPAPSYEQTEAATADEVQTFEASPEAPENDNTGPFESGNDGTAEEMNEIEPEQFIEPKSSEQVESFENNHTEAVSESNVLDEGSNNIIQEDYIIPADVGSENLLQNHQSTTPIVSVSEPQPQMTSAPSMDDTEKQQYLATIAELESQLYQREEQLASKSDQITSLSLQHESETTSLRQVITETKEEARKRILRAKDRVEEMQTKLTDAVRRADAAGGSSQEQSDLIAALRSEGEQLARKHSQMEQSVRAARGEARELQEQLEIEKDAREKGEAKAGSFEKEVKSLKEELSSARKGETLSKKLEGELVAAKEESEKQRASNMVLEQELKELKEERKSLKKEVEDARAGAALELEGESNKLRKERDDMLGDLENKLRTSDREANAREDALRHEVSELRKRWQDAVRRAEDLSMDVQHSTAPLMRQLESTERQNRTRAAAWAELESKLRSDVEDHVIQVEKLTKERNDLVASDKRSHRLMKEKEEEIASSQETIDVLSAAVETLETRVEELEDEEKRIKQELVVAERKASEGASKVRNEMMQTVVDSEERYRSQIEALEDELDGERQRRGNLEQQLDNLAESVAAATEFSQDNAMGGGDQRSPAKEKKLISATDQASILHDTLVGFDSDVDDDEGDEDGMNQLDGRGSFAAMEQLSQGLKGAKVELEALRKQLASSEETRESLLEELGEARQAVEKLPLFEQKVTDLTMEVKLKDMEIQGLQDDIADVRFLYRTQLDVLLEEKASSHLEDDTPTPSSHLEDDEEPAVRVDESS